MSTANILVEYSDIGQKTYGGINSVLPNTTYRVVGRNSTDTLKNKTLADQSNNIAANALMASDGTILQINDTPNEGDAIIVSGGQLIFTPATSVTVFAPFSQTLSVYVDKSGNDTTGDGTPNKPYATIAKAYSVITDASTIKRYAIKVGTGRFDEGALVVKPWIWLVGIERTATRVTSTSDLSLDPSFANGNFRFGFKDLLISGSNGVNFDMQTLGGSGSIVCEAQSFFVNNKFVYKCRTTADFLESWDCQWLGTGASYALEFYAGALLLKNAYLQNTLLISDVGGSENVFATANGIFLAAGNVTINRTRNNTFQVDLGAIDYSYSSGGTLALSNTTTGNLEVYVDSTAVPRTLTTSGSVLLTRVNTAQSIGYTPTTSANWITAPSTVQGALDNLAGGNNVYSMDPAVTAHAGGGQGSAYPITKYFTNVTTVATVGDSLVLPNKVGQLSVVKNNTANSAAVFPPVGGTIDGGSVNASLSVTSGNTKRFICIASNTYVSY